MASTTLKGIVKEVKPVEFYGEGNTGRRQTVVVFVPGFTNEFGEKVTKDELWGIDLFNKKIDEHALNQNCVSKKVEVEAWLSSREFDRKDGAKGYGISATLKSIKLGDTVKTSSMGEENGTPVDDDDLPF